MLFRMAVIHLIYIHNKPCGIFNIIIACMYVIFILFIFFLNIQVKILYKLFIFLGVLVPLGFNNQFINRYFVSLFPRKSYQTTLYFSILIPTYLGNLKRT